MGIYQRLSLIFLTFFVVGSLNAALNPLAESGSSPEKLNEELRIENEHLSGEWNHREDWEGTLCNGHYEYQIGVQADIERTKVDFTEGGRIIVGADFVNTELSTSGKYWSDWSLCALLRGAIPLLADKVETVSHVTFSGDDGTEMHVKVVKTRVSNLRFSASTPKWFRDFLTYVSNEAFEAVWKSRLGDWLSEKLTEIIKQKVPTAG